MTDRISDEALDHWIERAPDYPVRLALQEAKESRALITEVRALSERIEEAERGNVPTISPRKWARRLRSLLAAHDRPSEATET